MQRISSFAFCRQGPAAAMDDAVAGCSSTCACACACAWASASACACACASSMTRARGLCRRGGGGACLPVALSVDSAAARRGCHVIDSLHVQPIAPPALQPTFVSHVTKTYSGSGILGRDPPGARVCSRLERGRRLSARERVLGSDTKKQRGFYVKRKTEVFYVMQAPPELHPPFWTPR